MSREPPTGRHPGQFGTAVNRKPATTADPYPNSISCACQAKAPYPGAKLPRILQGSRPRGQARGSPKGRRPERTGGKPVAEERDCSWIGHSWAATRSRCGRVRVHAYGSILPIFTLGLGLARGGGSGS